MFWSKNCWVSECCVLCNVCYVLYVMYCVVYSCVVLCCGLCVVSVFVCEI